MRSEELGTCFCSETDPNWDLDIGNDVKDESEKYGQVLHHYVDKNSKVSNASFELGSMYVMHCMQGLPPDGPRCTPSGKQQSTFILSLAKADDLLWLLQGFVYLKFLNPDGASKAQTALNGRWFAGRQIAADFQFPAVYNNHFRL